MAKQQQIICSWVQGFPDVSAGKESACNAADIKDTVLMPGSLALQADSLPTELSGKPG